MGVLIEVTKAPDQEHRFIVCPGNTYSGPKSVKFVSLAGACVNLNGTWTGKTSMVIAQAIFDDFSAAADRGAEAEWFKTIRVTSYHNDANRRDVLLPRVAETAHVEPDVLPVAQASDGCWRYVPTTGFKKGPRDWVYSGAFVDGYGEPRIVQTSGKSKLECVLKLFGTAIPPFVAEFVRTFPLANAEDIPREPEPEKEYVPTQAEMDAVPPMTTNEWTFIPVETHKRRYVLDWKYRVAYHKLMDLIEIQEKAVREKKSREIQEKEFTRLRDAFRKQDAVKAMKGDL